MECDSIKRVHSTSPGDSKKRKRVEKEKTEIENIQEAYKQYKRESETKYNELKEENLKLKEELEKLQTENVITEVNRILRLR